jgi:hypothetical protein
MVVQTESHASRCIVERRVWNGRGSVDDAGPWYAGIPTGTRTVTGCVGSEMILLKAIGDVYGLYV